MFFFRIGGQEGRRRVKRGQHDRTMTNVTAAVT
jgi:hypothetical protein